MQPRILVLENDNDFRVLICERLQAAGYQTAEALVKSQVSASLSRFRFAAAIVDVKLQDETDPFDWSGLVLARHIAGSNVPVIILTAYDDSEAVGRAYQVAPGVQPPYAFISKNASDWREKLTTTLAEITDIRSPRWWTWLKEHGEDIASALIRILKRVFPGGES
jgi:CheY-like chemotaxis protein